MVLSLELVLSCYSFLLRLNLFQFVPTKGGVFFYIKKK